MIYAVLFEDNPDRANERRDNMPAHLDFLERNAAQILSAGPLNDAQPGAQFGPPAGGLWLVEADSAAEVTFLVESDPFWPTGLRRSVRVLQWQQVFAAGKRRI